MQENPFVRSDAAEADTLARLGLTPAQPFYDLNLAGTQSLPTPQLLAQPDNMQPHAIVLPDFGTQSYDIPAVQSYDLTGPGITYMPEFTSDPTLPDLVAHARPYSLDFATQELASDPQLVHAIPTPSEIASSIYPGLGFTTLDIQHNATDVDPLVPDLQYPDLTQQIHMPPDERPGSLDSSVLDMMSTKSSFQQASNTAYPESWMDQRGMNTTRERHMSLLNNGLDE